MGNDEKQSKLKPHIFEYTDYRLFLKDTYQYFKMHKTGFSYRFFSKEAGFSSPNFLKLVIEGKRNLSLESLPRFCQALKLNQHESSFFHHLVLFNQATTSQEKSEHAAFLFRSNLFKNAHRIEQSQLDYYSYWYMIPVRELVAHKNFKNDPSWIAKTLKPSISRSQAQHAIEELKKLNLIKKDKDGKLRQCDAIVATLPEVQSTLVARFHREMMRLASESIDRFPRTEREISANTVGLSEKNALRIKEMIQNFREELLKIAAEEQDVERIYQMNFHLFPLTEKASVIEKINIPNKDDDYED